MTFFDEPAVTGNDRQTKNGTYRLVLRIGLRVVGLAIFVFYLARDGALWPFGVLPAVIVACLGCWLAWVVVGDKLPGAGFLVLLGLPALVGSILGAVPGRFELAIIFAMGGIIGIIARAKIGIHIGLAAAALCLIAFEITAIAGAETIADWAWTTFGLVVAGVIGYARRQAWMAAEQTRQLIAAQQQLLAQADTLRSEQARVAALDERGRIARDLHDVLAHALGGLVVQLDAAEGLLSVKGDVDGATARVLTARNLAVEGLDDARKAVSALRAEAPGLSDALRSMADDYDGGSAEFRSSGVAADLPQETAVALIAVVREALTNTRKHAAGADVTVALRIDDETIGVDVINAAGVAGELAQTGSGAGIDGMRERMDTVHGTLRAGPAEGGAWRVSARVPAESGARPSSRAGGAT